MGRNRKQRKDQRKKRNEERRNQLLQGKVDGARIRTFFKMKERSGDIAEFDLKFSDRPVVVADPENDDLKAKDAIAAAALTMSPDQTH